ncbi:MAG: Glu-tRNA(Gln) amidotransferase GatDE subunit D [Candidatus Nanohalarchaeota archaeon]|nr:MAG: Glu-tRNA(Gln) amidotransferase GatDE subunit D [Candidatus Nanohaloarchaeota archaeon]
MESLKPYDTVEVKIKKDNKITTISGIVMPKEEGDAKNEICIRMENGYKIGLILDKNTTVKKTGHVKETPATETKLENTSGKNNQKILFISTGGTIASKIDYKTGAVIAKFTARELEEKVPQLKEIARPEAKTIFSEMSENLTPKHWEIIAKEIASNLNRNDIAGIILMHGTDTLGYTASALSFILKDIGKPVCIVGAQRSSDRGSSDTFMNLICASHVAVGNFAGVFCVMHANTDDDYCAVIKGTRARKMHSSRRDAFKSINEKPVAFVWENGKIKSISKSKKRDNNLKTTIAGNFSSDVMLIKTYPGLNPNVIDFAIKNSIQGIVIEGTGLGHTCTVRKNNFLPYFKKCAKLKIPVIMTTQTVYGRTNPNVYSAARYIAETGVIYVEDCISETAYVKLRWVLSQTKDIKEIEKLMKENVAGEIEERSEIIDYEMK